MTKADTHTLEDLWTQISALRAELDIQFTRMAQMQAELDALPQARERRKRARFQLPIPRSNGNEKSHI